MTGLRFIERRRELIILLKRNTLFLNILSLINCPNTINFHSQIVICNLQEVVHVGEIKHIVIVNFQFENGNFSLNLYRKKER